MGLCYIILFTILLSLANIISQLIPVKIPPFFSSPVPMTKYANIDLASVASGYKKFGSDIAWIQLLQYVGTPDDVKLTRKEKFLLELWSAKVIFGIDLVGDKKPLLSYHPDFSGGPEKHKDLLTYTLRVIRLDPHFHYAYLFSGGLLAWQYDRIEEAIELLREGIRNNPNYWQFHLYVSAILYKKQHKHAQMLTELEKAIRQKDAPNIVKVIVANYYEKEKRYIDALKIWLDVVETKDPMYYEKGLQKIEKFSKNLGINK